MPSTRNRMCRQLAAVAMSAAILMFGTTAPALAAVVEYAHGCDSDSNWYYLQYYNNGDDAADLNVCVVTNGSVANNHYDRVEARSYSRVFWIGTCNNSYEWYHTDDGSIDWHCR